MRPSGFFALVVALFFFLPLSLSAQERLAGKGPLEGKNFSPHFGIFFTLPGLSALPPPDTRFSIGGGLYLSQEFLAALEGEEIKRFSDFECLSVEASFRWYPSPALQLGVGTRVYYYYGGFLDGSVQLFHELLGFSNANREEFPAGEVYVDYATEEGYTFRLDSPAIGLGDIDLWAAWAFFRGSSVAAALFGGIKIPTGSMATLSGSGSADLAAALLLDARLSGRWSAYVNAGVVLPRDLAPMVQAISALEYALGPRLSLLAQLNAKSAALHGSAFRPNNLGLLGDQLSFPQTNILVGLRCTLPGWLLQLYVEEDAFTNNGVDFTFNMACHRLFE